MGGPVLLTVSESTRTTAAAEPQYKTSFALLAVLLLLLLYGMSYCWMGIMRSALRCPHR